MKKIGYLISFVIVASLVACNNNSNSDKLSGNLVNNPNTADGVVDTNSLPRFQFTEDVHDFGKIMQGEIVSYSFKFKNVGKSDLIIMSAKASCGCTVPEYPQKPIRPNEEGIIKVSFNSDGRKGIQSKSVSILANTQPNVKEISITADVVLPGN